MNPVIRERITVISVPIGTVDINGRSPISALGGAQRILLKSYIAEVFIVTNEPERSFHGTLRCGAAFDIIDSPIVTTDALATMVTGNPPIRIDDTAYEIRYDATSTEWNPSHPAYMRVSSKSERLGRCSFVPME